MAAVMGFLPMYVSASETAEGNKERHLKLSSWFVCLVGLPGLPGLLNF